MIWMPSEIVSIGDGSDMLVIHGGVTFVCKTPMVRSMTMTMRHVDVTQYGDEWQRVAPSPGVNITLDMWCSAVVNTRGEMISRIELGKYSVLDLLREVNKRIEKRE